MDCAPTGKYLNLTIQLNRERDLQNRGAGLDGISDSNLKIHDLQRMIHHVIYTLTEFQALWLFRF
jgi:hypothetical protein